jgi:hypothetical protein
MLYHLSDSGCSPPASAPRSSSLRSRRGVICLSCCAASEGGGTYPAAARAVSEGPFCNAHSIDILIAVRSMTRTKDREVDTCCGGEVPSSGGVDSAEREERDDYPPTF